MRERSHCRLVPAALYPVRPMSNLLLLSLSLFLARFFNAFRRSSRTVGDPGFISFDSPFVAAQYQPELRAFCQVH